MAMETHSEVTWPRRKSHIISISPRGQVEDVKSEHIFLLGPHPGPNLAERAHTITDKTDGITFAGFPHEALPAGAVASTTLPNVRANCGKS